MDKLCICFKQIVVKARATGRLFQSVKAELNLTLSECSVQRMSSKIDE